MFKYHIAEQIINSARRDLLCGYKDRTIEAVNQLLLDNDIYDDILLYAEEIMNIHNISIDKFLKSYSLEKWSDWEEEYNLSRYNLYHDMDLLDVSTCLKKCDDIDDYYLINHGTFLMGKEYPNHDLFFYVEVK